MYQPAVTGTLDVAGAETQTVDADLDLQGLPWGVTRGASISWGDGTPATVLDGELGVLDMDDYRDV